ncbi:DUF1513 domain-containing protein [Oceanobacter sp. 4_MG-2023]|uniref:DUF1513 domain-containing protein n=1 Tax=Oceanobacter sp. 4_MG-2023 TaxID=3062623 RepID=UPI0027357E28|nr:DUF1513 domain-containing protein [Oceanobacter sp. 4_MG-2023]MDP2549273.1 DUF1513 domain-containing protein [Oceanobacter sp. 4_MG-2023]
MSADSASSGLAQDPSRRRLLGGVASALAASALPGTAFAAISASRYSTSAVVTGTEAWVSAEGDGEDGYFASWIVDGERRAELHSASSGFRGHGLAQHPQRLDQAVMFARRPGTQALVLNLLDGSVEQVIECTTGHHMHGHGCFSPDGQHLLTTESDYRTGTGKLMVRNTVNWQLEAEYLTHGIGPHDVHVMPDGQSLVVANGGLLTHPDSGRKVLNLDTMDPSLVYLSLANGTLISQHRLPESKASIRHLALADDGTVAIATQLQRPAMHSHALVPLAAIHKPGQPLVTLQGPETLILKFNDYMGSAALHNGERIAAFSSPRGDLVAFWHLDTHQLVGYHAFFDVCGLTVSRDQQYFVLSNSRGDVRMIDVRSLKEDRAMRRSFAGRHWDNHMFTFTLPDQSV